LVTLFACSGGDGEALNGSAPANGGDTNGAAPANAAPSDQSQTVDPIPQDDNLDPEPMDDAAADAGAGDAGPNKAAWFGSTSRCASSGLKFCDSFEEASLNTNVWTVEKDGSNTLTLDTSQHARGN